MMKSFTLIFLALFFGIISLIGCADSPEVAAEKHLLDVSTRLDQLLKDWDSLQFKGEYYQERLLKKQIRDLVEKEYFLIIEALTGENSDYRAISAQALGFSDNPNCLGALVSVLNDPTPQVSINAGNALIRLGYSDVPLEAIERMLQSSNKKVRLVGTKILGRLGNPKGIPLLVLRIKDPNIEVCRQAVQSLGKIEDKKAIDGLVQHAIFDPREEIREAAAEALGVVPSKKALGPLVECLRDPHLGVQQAAWISLQKITQKYHPLQYNIWKDWLDNEQSYSDRKK